MNITFIGTGNIATQLSLAFKLAGVSIAQIYGRSIQDAQILANKVNAQAISDLTMIDRLSDVYFICVSDDAITSVVQAIPKELKGIVVHTAGSVDLSVLIEFSQHGVFYPLQTIQKEGVYPFKEIPILIEGNKPSIEEKLGILASIITNRVEVMCSKDRMSVHISAIFVSNFVNYLYTTALEILDDQYIPFDLLHPLMLETAQKAIRQSPKKSQTGPAKRGDFETIKKHLNALSTHPSYQKLYQHISLNIQEYYNKQ